MIHFFIQTSFSFSPPKLYIIYIYFVHWRTKQISGPCLFSLWSKEPFVISSMVDLWKEWNSVFICCLFRCHNTPTTKLCRASKLLTLLLSISSTDTLASLLNAWNPIGKEHEIFPLRMKQQILIPFFGWLVTKLVIIRKTVTLFLLKTHLMNSSLKLREERSGSDQVTIGKKFLFRRRKK